MKKEGHERRSLWKRMKQEYAQLTMKTWRMEWTGRNRIILQGGRKILLYGETKIALSVQDAQVRWIEFDGERLVCLNYHPDAIIIEGMISGVYVHEEEFKSKPASANQDTENSF